MKKITVTLLAAMLLITGASIANEMPVVKKFTSVPSFSFWVKFHLIFHKKSTECKTGFGFCLITTLGTEGGSNTSVENYCPVQMMLEGDQLFLQVTETALATWEQGSTLPYFKGKSSVTFEESAEIPADISRKLGSQVPLVIKAGTYPVTYRNGTYTVTFTL